MTIDLTKTEFAAFTFGKTYPKSEPLYYVGEGPAPFHKYLTAGSTGETTILAASVIRREEAEVWNAEKDLLNRAVKEAALQARGIFTFQVLSFNALREMATFNTGELGQLLANTSRTLRPGEEKLIQYSSVYGVLRKLVDEPWGKMLISTSVEILPESSNAIYAVMARVLKKIDQSPVPTRILINDLSSVPLYDAYCPDQRSELIKLSKKISKAPASRELWIEGKRIFPVTEDDER